MITTITILIFLGFFLLYHTSQKAVLSSSLKIAAWIHTYPKSGKRMGLSLLAAAILLCLVYLGIGAGLFSFFVILMTMGSLIVILTPLRLINWKVLIFIFLLSLIIELI
ncbi:hypothetical protein [Parapedobacter tibetensis]|uniref:hypothetical protein n=1 Tax=Parapedobacter tibetensis TaxID=2972951 RepID=UPI00214D9A90|nr:hypothetical protein [Parapedobacter tibetensis]